MRTTSTTPIDDPVTADEPAVRGEQRPAEPQPDPCIVDGEYFDDYELVDFPDNAGTTQWGFLPCTPIDTTSSTTAEVAEPAPVMELPATGAGETAGIAVIAAVLVSVGLAMFHTARREEVS